MITQKSITCEYPNGTHILKQCNGSLLILEIDNEFIGYVCMSEIYNLIKNKK